MEAYGEQTVGQVSLTSVLVKLRGRAVLVINK